MACWTQNEFNGFNVGFDIKDFLAHLPSQPGIYQMLDRTGSLLYVGKANNLKNRVSSYFLQSDTAKKQQIMLAQVHRVDIILTHTETEALILECNLIKTLKPKYNIRLKEGKGYPYIHLSNDEYPILSLRYGVKNQDGRYFGPYPDVSAARNSLVLMQQLFQLRHCENSVFQHRTRACLQYQIKRCSGPCVNSISLQNYQHSLRDAILFLTGKSQQLIEDWARQMELYSKQQAYEQAAYYRDQIINLRRIREYQCVEGEEGDLDIIASHVEVDIACIQVFFIRSGRNLGGKIFYPTTPIADTNNNEAILAAFIPQFYAENTIPAEILISQPIADQILLEQMLSIQAKYPVTLQHNVKAVRQHWIAMARMNAENGVARQLSSKLNYQQRLSALQALLSTKITYIECFDISHTSGALTIASCVAFDQQGPVKSAYRRFNIQQCTKGDDYAAMREALLRRYQSVQYGVGDASIPDLLVIDGGQLQIEISRMVLSQLNLPAIKIIGISKGVDRNSGLEKLFLSDRSHFLVLASNAPALHLLQYIRDEAHRFAIVGHRQRRAKKGLTSTLEQLVGVGKKRRQALLTQLGGLQEVMRASAQEIANVRGIGKLLAQKIYNQLHPKA